jgi:general L-amino acid transport system permease protein
MTDATITPPAGPASARYVRMEQAEALPPPASLTGWQGWVRENLFSSPINIMMTVIAIALIWLIVPPILSFAIFDAVWTGADREACVLTPARPVVGACWPFVADRFQYFVFGSYPVEERWRPLLFFVLLLVSVVWVLWLNAPRRDIGMIFAFLITPFVSYWLLTGGTPASALIGVGASVVRGIGGGFGTIASVLEGIPLIGVVLALPFQGIYWLLTGGVDLLMGALRALFPGRLFFWFDLAASAAIGFALLFKDRIRYTEAEFSKAMMTVAGLAIGFGLLVAVTGLDAGLTPVPTNLWGGILISLIVASVGIVFSLPFGILLALGRRSKLPMVKLFSVILIEFVRGVPFITVLFMASNMLPLFVPEQYAPDKLLRALIAAAIFASAYMAEVVRAGLQALPKGQYEGAMAMGLGYWQMMRLIILPQALKVTIPNIVNTYIGLFKDTTLVVVVGLFDFLKTIEAARIDPQWAAPTTSATGYFFAAIFYFICCYAMSRYAKATEQRLAKADKR